MSYFIRRVANQPADIIGYFSASGTGIIRQFLPVRFTRIWRWACCSPHATIGGSANGLDKQRPILSWLRRGSSCARSSIHFCRLSRYCYDLARLARRVVVSLRPIYSFISSDPGRNSLLGKIETAARCTSCAERG